MKIYKTQSEVEKDIKNGVLVINDDVTFECSISIDASINAYNINAGDIHAGDIKANDIDAGDINAYDIKANDIDAGNIKANDINAGDIKANDIDAGDINAYDIDAGDIKANNINAGDIDAGNINAYDINAGDIKADDISYYAFCCSYNSIKCSSIEARRKNHSESICLDGKLEIKEQRDNATLEAIKLLEEKGYKIIKK